MHVPCMLLSCRACIVHASTSVSRLLSSTKQLAPLPLHTRCILYPSSALAGWLNESAAMLLGLSTASGRAEKGTADTPIICGGRRRVCMHALSGLHVPSRQYWQRWHRQSFMAALRRCAQRTPGGKEKGPGLSARHARTPCPHATPARHARHARSTHQSCMVACMHEPAQRGVTVLAAKVVRLTMGRPAQLRVLGRRCGTHHPR